MVEQDAAPSPAPSSLFEIQQRFKAGKITRDEYERLLEMLRNDEAETRQPYQSRYVPIAEHSWPKIPPQRIELVVTDA